MPKAKPKPEVLTVRNARNYTRSFFMDDRNIAVDPGFDVEVPADVARRLIADGWTLVEPITAPGDSPANEGGDA